MLLVVFISRIEKRFKISNIRFCLVWIGIEIESLPEILATLTTRKVNLLNGYVRPMIEAYHILPPSRWQIT